MRGKPVLSAEGETQIRRRPDHATYFIANVALNIFTNYFNEAANTEVDFPKVV